MKHYFFYLSTVLIFTFLVHITYIPNGFAWLDHRDIESQRAIVPLSKIHKAFKIRFADTGFYRPMVTIFHSIDYAFYKNWAPGFHLTNGLLHTAATAALPGFVASFFLLEPWQILLTTLIFGIHPFSILPVGAISYRPELLLALFVFLAIHFYSKARLSANLKNTAYFLVCFFLALLSKETALVILPLLIIFWEFLHFKKPKKSFSSLLPGIFVLLASYILLRFRAVPEIWRVSQIHLSPFEAFGTRLATLGNLLTNFVNPFKPDFSDATKIISLTHPSSLAVIIAIAGIFLLLVHNHFRSQISTSVLLIAILLAPSLNIIPLPRFSSPHYGYLAVSGFAALIVLLFAKTRGSVRKLYRLIIVIWIFLISVSTFKSGYQFKNDLSLFLPEVKNNQNFLEGHYYLGNYYLSKGDLNSAQKHYQTILLLPKNVIAFGDRFSFYLNLGNISMLQNRKDEANKFYNKTSLHIVSPDQRMILDFNKALLAQKYGDHQTVIKLVTPYINKSNQPEPLILLARSLAAMGKEKEAKQIIIKTLPLLPLNQRDKIRQILNADQ